VSYWPLEPAFVLNFEGKSKARFMQIGLEVSTTSDKSYAAVKKHLPVIRNEIVLLLSGQKYEEMVTPEGKEQLRAELIETINIILKKHKAKKGIDNIYFTSFVMQ
jgi:flagellar FliL protein